MVKCCVARNCKNKFIKGSEIRFYRFPAFKKCPDRKERYLKWVQAIKRKHWTATPNSYVCSEHFQTGAPSLDVNHPDYVPNVFAHSKPSSSALLYEKRKKRILSREARMRSQDSNAASPGEVETDPTAEDDQSEPDIFTLTDKEEAELLRQQLFQVATELAKKIEQEADLTDKLDRMTAENKSLQQTNNQLSMEVNNLRQERNSFAEKLGSASWSTAMLQDKSVCKYYTGLDDENVFKWLCDVWAPKTVCRVQVVDYEVQLLIALIKLRRGLDNTDLAYRFGVSIKTICRVIEAWLPDLAGSLHHLLQCHSTQR